MLQKEAEQQALVHRGDIIPSSIISKYEKHLPSTYLRLFGFKFRGGRRKDPALRDAHMPEGWENVPIKDDVVWSKLRDPQGRVRGSAFLDVLDINHTPRLFLPTRFDVQYDFQTAAVSGHAVVHVFEEGRIIYSPRPFKVPRSADTERRREIMKEVLASGSDWLDKQGYPNWRSPGAYWG